MSMFSSKPFHQIETSFTNVENRQTINQTIGESKEITPLFIYSSGDNITGEVKIKIKNSKKLEYRNISIAFIGQIELTYDPGNPTIFITEKVLVAKGGILTGTNNYSFNFQRKRMRYESYKGTNVNLRYFVRVIIDRNISTTYSQDKDFWVMNVMKPPLENPPINIKVGLKSDLNIDITLEQSQFHLTDVIKGIVNYYIVKIQFKSMGLSIIKREITKSNSGMNQNIFTENETIAKFEIMDGAPVQGDKIPIRFFLRSLNLTPTFPQINNIFSVRYFLNLVLVDKKEKRYFRETELVLYRNALPEKKPILIKKELSSDK
ncbi:vacuolar protein sorting-associated protein [Anaeramoeba flamelloides]|uniref:Vacuolar protein sorting-associated protein n=1 Tax=Anaeramoeba flamelloides TaxID=1746091 RepID=A0ABQ8YLZ6_9EUKA|nr:vacuolar protein sorting-associated protein [Anaeramoeba flamelloides]